MFHGFMVLVLDLPELQLRFLPPSFPCLRCIFESEPPAGSAPTCDTAGILWPAVGAVVSYQITAAFKILTAQSIAS